jgi:hypothetical protein
MFDLALRALVKTPASITKAVSDINRRTGARGHVARANAAADHEVAPLYLSDGMPGPFLDLRPAAVDGLGSEMERARELREWHELWRRPRMRAAMAALTAPDSGVPGSPTWR